jgi:hypothetical protein
MRQRWPDLVFVALAAGILGWVAWDAFSFRLITHLPGSDYWEHTAVLRALIEDPLHPRHPSIVTTAGSPRFGPHYLAVALVAKVMRLGPIDAMALASVLNTTLFLLGIFLFFRRYFGDARASLYGLVVLFGSWLADSPHFSNVYKLSVFFSVAGYPSTSALAVTLLVLTLVVRLLRGDTAPPALLALAALGVAYVYVTHPLTAMMSLTAVVALAATEPGVSRRRRVMVAAAVPAGLLLACLWPYYPALGMVAGGTTERVGRALARRNVPLHEFYSTGMLRQILGYTLLAVPCLGFFVVVRRHLFVVLGALAMLTVFVGSALVPVPLGHRFVLLAVFFLQVALVFLLLALTPSGDAWPRHSRARVAAALGTGLFLVYLVVANVQQTRERFAEFRGGVSPTVRVGRRIGQIAGKSGVVLGDPLPCWSVPTFGPRIVALHHSNPLVPDTDERTQQVRRFFAPGTPNRERESILRRYAVTHVLFTARKGGSAERFVERRGEAFSLPAGLTLYALTPPAP